MTDLLNYPSLNLCGDVIDLYPDNTTYSSAVWLTSHNSFVNIDDGWELHPQQKMNVADQFEYGVRSFMIDVHENKNGLVLQHGHTAILSGATHSSKTSNSYLVDFLGVIKKLLDTNDQDIITLHIENYASNTAVKKELDKAGLSQYLLTTNPNHNELLLLTMRSSNQRLVVFSDEIDRVIGIHQVTLLKETTYDLGKNIECDDRQERRATFSDKSIKLFLLNHFYSEACVHDCAGVPSHIASKDCSVVNSYTAILYRVKMCLSHGNFPNFIAVDFVEKGDFGGAKALVIELNRKSKDSLLSGITPTSSTKNTVPVESGVNMAIHFIGVPLMPTMVPLALDMLFNDCRDMLTLKYLMKYAKYFAIFTGAQVCNYFIKSSVGHIVIYSVLSFAISLSNYRNQIPRFLHSKRTSRYNV